MAATPSSEETAYQVGRALARLRQMSAAGATVSTSGDAGRTRAQFDDAQRQMRSQMTDAPRMSHADLIAGQASRTSGSIVESGPDLRAGGRKFSLFVAVAAGMAAIVGGVLLATGGGPELRLPEFELPTVELPRRSIDAPTPPEPPVPPEAPKPDTAEPASVMAQSADKR